MSVRNFPRDIRIRCHASRTKDLVIVAWEMVDRGMPREQILATLALAEAEARKLSATVDEVV